MTDDKPKMFASEERTFPDDFQALVERVDRLEKEKDEMEQGIVQMILIFRQFLNNPKVKQSFGGHWMTPETAAEIERKLSGTDGTGKGGTVPGAPEAQQSSDAEPNDR